jgi:hypothetical protein
MILFGCKDADRAKRSGDIAGGGGAGWDWREGRGVWAVRRAVDVFGVGETQ